MTRLAASKIRERFSDTLNRVAYRGERFLLHRRGKPLAAIVPIEDLKVLEEFEDKFDIEAARKALKEKGRIPYEKIRRRGLYRQPF